jgi:hypothetical protein
MSDFFITAAIIRITNRNKIKRRQRYLRNNARISKKFLKAFNIKLNVKHIENLKQLHKLPYLPFPTTQPIWISSFWRR